MKRFQLIIILISAGIITFAQKSDSFIKHSNLEILIPTGEISNDLYVLKKAPENDTAATRVQNIVNSTFMGESVLLFNYVQNYLLNIGIVKESEPPRLAITNRQGCFGVMGFVLDENGTRSEKLNSGYVDLYKGMFSTDYSHLESITQLFPHEMGHVIQMYLCSDQNDFEPESKSPNMHYFNIITCYNTAFSEGFAEHFENIARKMEPSEKVRKGIFKDIEIKSKAMPRYIAGFDRDFKLPLRTGFYRAITPLWFQQLENLKRYNLVENGYIRYKNKVLRNSRISDDLLYRNTGVSQDLSRIRNAAQAASTEGVISAFFSGLVLSSLGEKYLDDEFYPSFVNDSLTSENLKDLISPLHNEYMKIFHVLKKYVRTNHTERGQLFDFADGYCKEFPEESGQLMEILASTTGVTGIPKSLPEIWILNKDVNYKFWVMAQFGLTIPYYAFNLNAADSLDLVSFDGISGQDASKIIVCRDRNGFFQSAEEINNVPDLSEKTKRIIMNNIYDEKNVPPDEGRPNFMSLLYLPLLHMSVILLIWFVFILAFYLYLIKNVELSPWQRIRKSLHQLLKFLTLALLGLICLALFSMPWKLFIVTGLAIIGIKAILLRNKKPELRVSLLITAVMLLVILYSLI